MVLLTLKLGWPFHMIGSDQASAEAVPSAALSRSSAAAPPYASIAASLSSSSSEPTLNMAIIALSTLSSILPLKRCANSAMALSVISSPSLMIPKPLHTIASAFLATGAPGLLCLLRAGAFLKEKPTVLVMSLPARVILLSTGRTGGEDIGGESSAGCTATNTSAIGPELAAATDPLAAAGVRVVLGVGSGVRAGDPSQMSGGVRGSRDASKPGGLLAGLASMRTSGTSIASASLASSEDGGRGESSSGRAAPSSEDRTISLSWPEPLAVGDDEMMEVGDDGGSGVAGGVSAARERRLAARGEAERALDLPRRRGSP